MSTQRGNARIPLRPPSSAVIVEMAKRDHLELSDEEAEGLAPVIGQMVRAIEQLSELPSIELPPSPFLHRLAGRRPTQEEDPWNAFIRICDVRGADSGPLFGKTVGLKDNIDLAGVPTSNSSPVASYVPINDAVVAERILAAGGRIVGKLNMDNFGAGATGDTSGFGPPLNPRDRTKSAGGSSGGSGSAVASGAVDLALGVDQGGSARIPAAFCGVVAIKATHGLVPSHGVTHLDHTIDFVCPMAATVDDAALLLEVIAGEDWRDPQWVRGPIPRFQRPSDPTGGLQGLSVGLVLESCPEDMCDKAVLDNLRRVTDILRDAGAIVRDVNIPVWPQALPITQTLLCHLVGAMVKSEGVGYGHLGLIDVDRLHGFALSRRLESKLLPVYMKVWMIVERYLHDEYLNVTYGVLHNLRLRVRREIDEALHGVDLLLTPTCPKMPPPVIQGDVTAAAVAGPILEWVPYNTAPLNLSGHPVVAMPSGMDSAGIPTSVQLVGRRFEETTAIQAGRALERSLRAISAWPALASGSQPRTPTTV